MSDSVSTGRMRALRDAVARKKAEVQALKHRQDAAEQELRRLEAELRTFDLPHPVPVGEPSGFRDFAPAKGAAKIALFRLFPNQDTMPRGGFGNLIALPLQHGPRAKGNTVFVDAGFHPFPDQWAYLAGLQRIPVSIVERVATDALRGGKMLEVRPSGMEEEDSAAPWLLPPSRLPPPMVPVVDERVPARVEATLAQRMFIEKTGLPASVTNALRRLAAFQHPEFYQKQRMRLSTARAPRIINCAEDFSGHVALPRGCVDDAAALHRALGATLEIDDQRERGQAIEHRATVSRTPRSESKRCASRQKSSTTTQTPVIRDTGRTGTPRRSRRRHQKPLGATNAVGSSTWEAGHDDRRADLERSD